MHDWLNSLAASTRNLISDSLPRSP